ncbi:hypothetical protein SAZ11_08830 [Streptomyces sp. FXJ1.4098]|nr:hypothetical protein [Streptomyces sp. FXJ1.4098]
MKHSPAWAEHRTRFAIELVGDGVSGWQAPVGETVAQMATGDLAAGLIGHDAAARRRLAYRKKTGRHSSGRTPGRPPPRSNWPAGTWPSVPPG